MRFEDQAAGHSAQAAAGHRTLAAEIREQHKKCPCSPHAKYGAQAEAYGVHACGSKDIELKMYIHLQEQ